jgi:hypothetical protein
VNSQKSTDPYWTNWHRRLDRISKKIKVLAEFIVKLPI